MGRQPDKLPKISIVTPTLNQVDFIERTIRSVVGQDYPNLEYIIKDGGSTDGSLEIIKKYAQKYPEIIRFISEQDRGQSDAINQGLKMVKGEIVAYINSDDTYQPGAFRKVARYFTKHPETVWVTGRCRIIDERDREIRKWITAYKNLWLTFYTYPTHLMTNYVSQPATFWRRKIHREVGYFDQELYYSMDYDFLIRVAKRYRPAILNDYLASFRIHSKSKAVTGLAKPMQADFDIARKYTQNPLIIAIHYFLNAVAIAIYTGMAAFFK